VIEKGFVNVKALSFKVVPVLSPHIAILLIVDGLGTFGNPSGRCGPITEK
jgi:hypothetical protein